MAACIILRIIDCDLSLPCQLQWQCHAADKLAHHQWPEYNLDRAMLAHLPTFLDDVPCYANING